MLEKETINRKRRSTRIVDLVCELRGLVSYDKILNPQCSFVSLRLCEKSDVEELY